MRIGFLRPGWEVISISASLDQANVSSEALLTYLSNLRPDLEVHNPFLPAANPRSWHTYIKSRFKDNTKAADQPQRAPINCTETDKVMASLGVLSTLIYESAMKQQEGYFPSPICVESNSPKPGITFRQHSGLHDKYRNRSVKESTQNIPINTK